MKKKEIKSKPKEMSVSVLKKSEYKTDFYNGVFHQVQILKKKEYSKLDLENVIEELESLGISDKKSIQSYLMRIMQHKLKLIIQPEKHTKSWDRSIINSQTQIELILLHSPSLRKELDNLGKSTYQLAVRKSC